DLLARNEREVAVEPLRVTAVANDANAMTRLLVEAVSESVQPRVVREDARVHLLGRRGGKDTLAVVLAVVEMRDHELRHVRRRRRYRPSWPRARDDLPLVWLERAAFPLVAVRHLVRVACRQRLARRGLRAPSDRKRTPLNS